MWIKVLIIVIATLATFTSGYFYANKGKELDNISNQMHTEHNQIIQNQLEIKATQSIQSTKLDSIDKKLDLLVNIAAKPYLSDLNR